MNLFFVSAELSPLSGKSELGRFVAHLGGALSSLGHDVTVVCAPLNDQALINRYSLARRLSTLNIDLHDGPRELLVYDGKLPSGVSVKVLDHRELASEGDEDAPLRGALLSRAALEVMSTAASAGGSVHVLHAFGLQAALTPFLALGYPALESVACVYSVESIAHQGRCDRSWVERLGLSWDDFVPSRLEFFGDLNLLKAALISSDRIVFPGYAALLDAASEKGQGLEGVVQERRGRLAALLPGLDYSRWNPATDAEIPVHFDAEQTEGKRSCKAHIQYLLQLPICSDIPVVILAPGLEELGGPFARVFERLLRSELQVVIARDQSAELSAMAETMVNKYPRKVVHRAFSESEWHQALAGADIAIVDSPGEFDGERILSAMRYGALPLVPNQGVARDLVVDLCNTLESGNGFLVSPDDADELIAVLCRAIASLRYGPEMENVRRRTMGIRCSWEDRARHIEGYYAELLPPSSETAGEERMLGAG